MENKSRILFFIIFLLIIQNIFTQERPVHRLTWESEYAFNYEIIIQRLVNDDYEDYYNDFIKENYIDISLPVGQYRFQVIPYDMLEHPGEPSYWAYLNVMPRVRTADTAPEKIPEEAPEETSEEIVKKEIIKGDFWFGFSGDTAFYSADGYSYGGGLSLGYGKRLSFGLKASWFFSTENIDTIEANTLLRFYFFSDNPYYGPFLQLMGGYSHSFPNGNISIPSNIGFVSAGVGFGWRFLLTNFLYIEPYIRAGYPYMAGTGVVLGFRFGEKRKSYSEQVDSEYDSEYIDEK